MRPFPELDATSPLDRCSGGPVSAAGRLVPRPLPKGPEQMEAAGEAQEPLAASPGWSTPDKRSPLRSPVHETK